MLPSLAGTNLTLMSHQTEIILINMTNTTLQLVSGIANDLLAFYVKKKGHVLFAVAYVSV